MRDVSYEKLLESLFEGVYYVDLNKRITYWNKAAERITGFDKSEVIGFCCSDNILRHIDDTGKELCVEGCPLAKTLQDGKPRETNIYLHHKQGHRVPVTVRISPVRDDNGEMTGAIEIFADNSNYLHILQELEKLKQEVYIDELTHVGNRRYGEMSLQTRLYELETFQVPFGVIFLDIDHFKIFNDTYGHQTGDAVLVMVAKTLTNILRRLDVISRWGGEEFVIILPNITAALLKRVADRTKLFIAQSFLMSGEEKLSITASIGATLARPEDSSESVIQRADGLMYTSKRSGRNRVTIG